MECLLARHGRNPDLREWARRGNLAFASFTIISKTEPEFRHELRKRCGEMIAAGYALPRGTNLGLLAHALWRTGSHNVAVASPTSIPEF